MRVLNEVKLYRTSVMQTILQRCVWSFSCLTSAIDQITCRAYSNSIARLYVNRRRQSRLLCIQRKCL